MELTNEELEAFRGYDKFMKEYHEGCDRINNRILKAVKSVKGESFYNNLLDVMKDSQVTDTFKLVRKPMGEYLTETTGEIKGVYVDQMAVGTEGDSWEGTVTVKLKDKLWLEMPFSM